MGAAERSVIKAELSEGGVGGLERPGERPCDLSKEELSFLASCYVPTSYNPASDLRLQAPFIQLIQQSLTGDSARPKMALPSSASSLSRLCSPRASAPDSRFHRLGLAARTVFPPTPEPTGDVQGHHLLNSTSLGMNSQHSAWNTLCSSPWGQRNWVVCHYSPMAIISPVP